MNELNNDNLEYGNDNLEPQIPVKHGDSAVESAIKEKIQSHKLYFIITIIILVAVGISLLWYVSNESFNFEYSRLNNSSKSLSAEPEDVSSDLNEIDNLDSGDLDSEFKSIDQELDSL